LYTSSSNLHDTTLIKDSVFFHLTNSHTDHTVILTKCNARVGKFVEIHWLTWRFTDSQVVPSDVQLRDRCTSCSL